MNTRRILCLTLLTAALAVAVFYTLVPSRSPEQGSSTHHSRLAAAFRIFRTPTKTLPQRDARRINADLEANGLPRPAEIHLAATEQGRLWVFNSARQICISHVRGIACSSWRQAMQAGLFLGVFDPPDEHRRDLHNFLVQGIVPNDVDRVLVLVNNRRHLTLDVEENVFSLAADRPIHVKRLLRD